MAKIELTDSTMDVITKISEGNPGCLAALTEIMQKHDKIDPQAAMGWVGAVLILDTWEIYGSHIYILWNDVCGRDVRKLLMLMRATQLGLFPEHRLRALSEDRPNGEKLTSDELADLDNKVCEQLEQFARPESVAA